VIVGGGPVGLEFATVFTALGIPVTLVDHGAVLLPSMDQEMVAVLAAECTGRGGRLVQQAGVDHVQRRDDRLDVTLSTGEVVATDAVLFAAGRTPNTTGLGLEDVGVEVDGRGRIVVDEYHRTTVPGIYAVGDAIGPALASLSAHQGRAATCHALGLVFGVTVDRAGSSAVYGLPEIAGVGATEERLRADGTPYLAGRCDLATTARGAISGHGGRLKLLFRPDDRRLLGVHCVGDAASEVVGLGHVALQTAATLDVFLVLALNTPTYASAYRDAAIDGVAQLAQQQGHPRPDARRAAARA
jgi:NAD(P) transhydrogenase